MKKKPVRIGPPWFF